MVALSVSKYTQKYFKSLPASIFPKSDIGFNPLH